MVACGFHPLTVPSDDAETTVNGQLSEREDKDTSFTSLVIVAKQYIIYPVRMSLRTLSKLRRLLNQGVSDTEKQNTCRI